MALAIRRDRHSMCRAASSTSEQQLALHPPTSKTPAEEIECHAKVSDFLRRRKIHRAEDLYEAAKERGEQWLLEYCVGAKAGEARRNLQATIDALWAAERSAAVGDLESSRDHAAPLTPAKLEELAHGVKRARSMASPATAISQAMPVRRRPRSGISKVRDCAWGNLAPCPGANGDPTYLLDSRSQRAEVFFRPRGGIWRLRDWYEALVACRTRGGPALAGAAPSTSVEGGFSVPLSPRGWRAMLLARVASPAVPFAELTAAQRAASGAELRFGVCCGELTWQPPASCVAAAGTMDTDAWIEAMPHDPRFEVDTLALSPPDMRLVRLYAYRNVDDAQWTALLRVLQLLDHDIQQTVGFMLKNGRMEIQGPGVYTCRSKHGAGNVQFGALRAQAIAAEALEDEGRLCRGEATRASTRTKVLLNGDPGITRRRMSRKSQPAGPLALENAPPASSTAG